MNDSMQRTVPVELEPISVRIPFGFIGMQLKSFRLFIDSVQLDESRGKQYSVQ